MKKHPPDYTVAEIEIIKNNYSSMPKEELLALLHSSRNWNAVRIKACKLGLKRDKEMWQYSGIPFNGSAIGHLTEAEKGYLAGLIDGEGCISLARRKRQTPRMPVYAMSVSIANTSKALMQWLDEKLPGSSYTVKLSSSYPNNRQCYSWVLSGAKQCQVFLAEISPYLVIKKRQAELLIGGYVHLCEQDREELYIELRDLKKVS